MALFVAGSFGVWAQSPKKEPAPNHHFKKGEHLEFRLSYGWFTVGKGSLDIDEHYYKYKDSECFKVEVKGSTAGLLGVFAHVDDTWGAYVRKGDLRPLHAYRNIEEGKYLREEHTYFHHKEGKVEVQRYNPVKDVHKKKIYDIPADVYDLMSSLLYFRNMDLSTFANGDTIRVTTFYEDELYHFSMIMEGKELIDSKVGELYAFKIKFIMPKSRVFPDENGVHAWVSEDSNHLPLRVEAEMFFGKGSCDLVAYRNVKYGPDYQ